MKWTKSYRQEATALCVMLMIAVFMKEVDEKVRTRLRISIWKQWKKPKTKRVNLEKLGIKNGKAYEGCNSSKGYCRIAHSPVLCRALNNQYFARLQYVGFANYYFWK